MTGTKIRVQRSNLLDSSVSAFGSLDKALLKANFGIEFVGEDGKDAGGLFKEWMSEISKLLITTPLFLPVFSEDHGTSICQRLNPLPKELGLEHPEHHLRLLGIVLGLSVVRKVPIGENLSMTLAKLLLGHQPELEDLQYELPDEYQSLSVLQNKSKQELDDFFHVDVDDESLHHRFTTKSRIIQLQQSVEFLRSRASSVSSRQLEVYTQFMARQAEARAMYEDDRVESKVEEDRDSSTGSSGDKLVSGETPRPGRERIVRGSNFKQYLQLTVHKLCVTNVKDLMQHLLPGFNDVVPEEKRRRLTPKELLDCWSGDIGLNKFQAVGRWRSMSTYDSHDQVTSWFWDIVQDSSQQMREAILQWSTGLRCLPLKSSSKFRIQRDKDPTKNQCLPTAQTCGGVLGQITLYSCASKDELREKLVRACEEMGFFIA